MKTAIWVVVIIIVIIGGVLLYRSKYSTGSTSSSTTATATTSVSIENFSFNPASISVTAGQEVTFTNNDSTTHTVTADDNSFNSGNLAPGKSFKKTFSSAGTFGYHCSIHTTMKGTVEVK